MIEGSTAGEGDAKESMQCYTTKLFDIKAAVLSIKHVHRGKAKKFEMMVMAVNAGNAGWPESKTFPRTLTNT